MEIVDYYLHGYSQFISQNVCRLVYTFVFIFAKYLYLSHIGQFCSAKTTGSILWDPVYYAYL